MKTYEVSEIVGMSKQTIMFYEKEGLLKPKREDNGYRNYSEEDVQTLKLIKLLRSMDIDLEDIKLILEGKLSFHECLNMKSEYIHQKVDDIQKIQMKIDEIKKRNMPMISSLNDIELKENKKMLGWKRGSDKVSLGRRLTRKHLIYQTVRNAIYVFSLTDASIIGFTKMYARSPSTKEIILIFLFYLIIALFLYTNNPTSGYYMHPMSEYFIECDEKGVLVFQPKNIFEYYKNVYTVLLTGKYKYEYYYLYEDICTLTVVPHKRKGATNLPPYHLSGYTMSFTFDFKDGRHLYMSNPMTLDHDGQLFAMILKEKCPHIVDEKHLLDALENDIFIDQHMGENMNKTLS